jgi:opacity protein-like surface antigen
MNKKTLLSLIVASSLSLSVTAEELPQAGTFNAGLQVSSGNIDHKNFDNDNDGVAQVMLYVDYYFKPGWAVEVGINKGSNVQDWICENTDDVDEDYCESDDESSSDSFKSDLDYSNFVVAVRFDRALSEHNFIYGKLGAQYFDYEMTDSNNSIFEEDSGTGIYSELGWKYQWSNNVSLNVGYQHIAMSKLTTSSLAIGIGYRF